MQLFIAYLLLYNFDYGWYWYIFAVILALFSGAKTDLIYEKIKGLEIQREK